MPSNSLSKEEVLKMLSQEKMHEKNLPFFSDEKCLIIAQAVKDGRKRIILDGRSFDIELKPAYPKYVFVKDAVKFAGPNACLDREELMRLLRAEHGN